jgi:ribonuclease D
VTQSYRLLQEAADIRAFLTSLSGCEAIALDLEADSLYSYPEKVCLVQVSTGDDNVVLDSLRGRSGLQAFPPILADRTVLKVLHGGDYDVRLLKKEFGWQVHNLADTMIAAQLTGRQNLGLADLLNEELGISIDKRFQRANWAQRPLPEEMLRYAALDTAHLLPLWQGMRSELAGLGRLAWAREEFALLEQAAPPPQRPPSCYDVKGATRLEPRQRAILQSLVEVREETALAWNRPPFKVLSDQVLLAWAEDPPSDVQQVRETPRANKGILRRLAPQIVKALRAAQSTPLRDCPQRHLRSRPPLSQTQRRSLRRLKEVRRLAAERLGLSVGLLVNTRTLETLTRAPPEEVSDAVRAQLKGWQFEVLGPGLVQALRG